MAAHQSTTDYLARTDQAVADVHARIRAQARTVSRDLSDLGAALSDRKRMLFDVALDETSPGVQPLIYEATDTLKAVERIANDAGELLGRLIAALGQDERMSGRLRDAEVATAGAEAADAADAATAAAAATNAAPAAQPPAAAHGANA